MSAGAQAGSWPREAAYEVQDAERLMEYACQRLRHLRAELPAERELQRVVDAALNGFFQAIHRCIAEAMPADVRHRIDDLLVGPGSGVFSAFEQLKVDPGGPGVENLRSNRTKVPKVSHDFSIISHINKLCDW